MGSKSAGPGGGDVQPFDMPPMQRTYTPEEWSARVGEDGGYPDPRVIRQGPQTGGPMMPFQPGPQRIPTGMGPVIGGQGAPPQMSNDDYLRMMYQTQLGRAPDQGGMDYWRNQLASGAVNRDQLQNNFRSSAEGQGYQQRMRPMMDDFIDRSPPNRQPFGQVLGQVIGGGMGGISGGPQRMSPEVLDAMRLAYERNRPQRTYTPEEWSATFGPNVEPDPRMIRQDAGRQPGQLPSNVSAALALLGRLGLGG